MVRQRQNFAPSSEQALITRTTLTNPELLTFITTQLLYTHDMVSQVTFALRYDGSNTATLVDWEEAFLQVAEQAKLTSCRLAW